jgi:hypothetical protein
LRRLPRPRLRVLPARAADPPDALRLDAAVGDRAAATTNAAATPAPPLGARHLTKQPLERLPAQAQSKLDLLDVATGGDQGPRKVLECVIGLGLQLLPTQHGREAA